MKSSLDILSALFKLLETKNFGIKGYIGDADNADQGEHYTLNCLSNPNEYLQVGYINLNIYLPEVKSGRANLARFKELIDLFIPVIEDTSYDNYYFQIDDDKGIFKDQDHGKMYFYNLKLIFQTL